MYVLFCVLFTSLNSAVVYAKIDKHKMGIDQVTTSVISETEAQNWKIYCLIFICVGIFRLDSFGYTSVPAHVTFGGIFQTDHASAQADHGSCKY